MFGVFSHLRTRYLCDLGLLKLKKKEDWRSAYSFGGYFIDSGKLKGYSTLMYECVVIMCAFNPPLIKCWSAYCFYFSFTSIS